MYRTLLVFVVLCVTTSVSPLEYTTSTGEVLQIPPNAGDEDRYWSLIFAELTALKQACDEKAASTTETHRAELVDSRTDADDVGVVLLDELSSPQRSLLQAGGSSVLSLQSNTASITFGLADDVSINRLASGAVGITSNLEVTNSVKAASFIGACTSCDISANNAFTALEARVARLETCACNTYSPTNAPTTAKPTAAPTVTPTAVPTAAPTRIPTAQPTNTPTAPDGTSAAGALASCRFIPSNYPSGLYWITAGGTMSPFQAYCDMTNDGGGWTLVARIVQNSQDHSDINAVGAVPIQTFDTVAKKLADTSIRAIATHPSTAQLKFTCGSYTYFLRGCTFIATQGLSSSGNACTRLYSNAALTVLYGDMVCNAGSYAIGYHCVGPPYSHAYCRHCKNGPYILPGTDGCSSDSLGANNAGLLWAR